MWKELCGDLLALPKKGVRSSKIQYSTATASPWNWAMQWTTTAALGFIPVPFETGLEIESGSKWDFVPSFSHKTKAVWFLGCTGGFLSHRQLCGNVHLQTGQRRGRDLGINDIGASGWVYTWDLCGVGNSEVWIRWPKLPKMWGCGLLSFCNTKCSQWRMKGVFSAKTLWAGDGLTVPTQSHSLRQGHPWPNPCNPTQGVTIHIPKRKIRPWRKRPSQVKGPSLPQSSWNRENSHQEEPMRSFLWEISLKGPASHFPLHPQPLTLLSCKGIGCPLLMNPRNPFPAAKPPFSTLPPTQRLEFSCSSVLRSAQKQQSLKSFCFQTLHPLLQLQSRNQCGAWRFCNTSWLLIVYSEIHKCWCFRDYWHNLAIPKLDKNS